MVSKPVCTDLNELLDFPCDYGFKAFGPTSDPVFADAVHAAINSVVPLAPDAMTSRSSAQGSYQCITVLVRVASVEQIHSIYAALKQIATLKYLL
ncbi:MAG: DUF493 domain-containing protein [Desulfuromonadales bacterium]|nr:DUF493 domain-containing protein [Desulfuromonadales bacterium]